MGTQHLHGGRDGLNHDTVFVIKVPDARVLHVVSRSLLLAMALVALSFTGSFMKGSVVSEFDATATSTVTDTDTDTDTDTESGFIDTEMLNLFLRDLVEEGLFKKEGRVYVMDSQRGLESDESYDFVLTQSIQDAVFADRILRSNGIVAFPLRVEAPIAGFMERFNYEVLYVRNYGVTVVALRKIGFVNHLVDSTPKRKLTQVKERALKGLEEVLLEPPRQGFDMLNKIKFLPELLGDSLEGYNRRVFIGIGLPEENRAAIEWFEQNYPKKGAKFQIHSLVAVPGDAVVPHMNVSAWLSKHVKEEDYVVMKAEADVVLEMMRKMTISLVDELFLECNNEWWQNEKRKKSGRAYWECLALYGRLRDEGVAVHQWWN